MRKIWQLIAVAVVSVGLGVAIGGCGPSNKDDKGADKMNSGNMDGKMDGLFVMGENPAVAGPNSGMERRALAKLKWLVVRDLVDTETSSFWRDAPEVKNGEVRPE